MSNAAGLALPDPTEVAWREFHGRLQAFVARRVSSSAEAEDIVQQVFLRMHRSLGTLRDARSVGGWLYQTARNAIVDHYRAPARRHEEPAGDTRELDLRQAAPDAPPEDDVTGLACVADCLRPLVDKLPDAYRRAIEQVELKGLTQLRASEAEGLSLSGMKARVQRGRQRLKTLLLEHCPVRLDARGSVVGCDAASTSRACGVTTRPGARTVRLAAGRARRSRSAG